MKWRMESKVAGILMFLLCVGGTCGSAAGQAIDTLRTNRGGVTRGDDSYYAQFDSVERASYMMNQSVMVLDTASVDSLAYARAERAYILGDYARAEGYLMDYTARFIGGPREYEALLMLGEVQLALGKEAEGVYNIGLAAEGTSDALVKSKANKLLAPIYERRGELERAYDAYMGGVEAADTPVALTEMYRKAVLIAGRLDAQEKLVAAADAMMASPGMSAGFVQFARYQRAYALLKMGRLDEAYAAFKQIGEGNRTEAGAECRYRMVEIALMQGEYDRVYKLTIWAAQQDKGGHDYWVAKGYLAMARALLAQGKTLDARKTLNSLVRGYPKEDDGIRKEAEEGLRAIMTGKQDW